MQPSTKEAAKSTNFYQIERHIYIAIRRRISAPPPPPPPSKLVLAALTMPSISNRVMSPCQRETLELISESGENAFSSCSSAVNTIS